MFLKINIFRTYQKQKVFSMEEEYKQTIWTKFKRFIIECKRVLRVTKKPNSVEFKTIVKVSGLGMGIVGLLGFLVQMIKQLFF
jgi:protein transport protein SEC61 subunit gamma and related proteins